MMNIKNSLTLDEMDLNIYRADIIVDQSAYVFASEITQDRRYIATMTMLDGYSFPEEAEKCQKKTSIRCKTH